MADRHYKLTLTMKDGSSHSVNFVAPQGEPGPPGGNGADGYKPVKGVDYFTEEDIEETASRAAELVSIKTDNTLRIDESGVLSVNTTSQMEQDNTLPITSAGVYTTVGNIEALLKTI